MAQPLLPFLAMFCSHLLPLLTYHIYDRSIYKSNNISCSRKKSLRVQNLRIEVVPSVLENMLEAAFRFCTAGAAG